MPNLIQISDILMNGLRGKYDKKLKGLGGSKHKKGERSVRAVATVSKSLQDFMDLRLALEPQGVRQAKKKKLPGPSAERALEIAEQMFAKGKKALALAWAKQAINKAKREDRQDIIDRANEIIKAVRGEVAIKMMGDIGDIDGLVMGRIMGLW